jgi:hypothetical protein
VAPRLPKPGQSLADLFPEIAAQADGWDPTKVFSTSSDSRKWRCVKAHLWNASSASRTSHGSRCPKCSGRVAIEGQTDVATTHPELAAQADGWDPTKFSAGSKLKFQWRCKKDHLWIATIGNRSRSGSGCPICTNRRVLEGFNDLATTHPELAKQADGWDPTGVTAGSNTKRQWICSHGHRWLAIPNVRAFSGTNCPICSGNVTLPGYNDLATTHPELAAQANGWDPTKYSAGSNKRLSWICNLQHSWATSICNRSASSGSGCPVCAGKKVLSGFNDIATTHREFADQADGWDPTTVTFGSQKRVQWKCKLNHQWTQTTAGRINNDSGCPYCGNKKILVGFNDLATTNPELAAQADGWDPTTVVNFTQKKVAWQCTEGHRWKANIASRSQGIGCPGCAKYGFDSSKNGWLYLVLNDTLNLLQVGISNVPEKRLKAHTWSGFDVVLDLRGPLEGQLTRDLENAILQMLKVRGAQFACDMDVKPFNGWTESWERNSFPVSLLKELLDFVYEDDELHK